MRVRETASEKEGEPGLEPIRQPSPQEQIRLPKEDGIGRVGSSNENAPGQNGQQEQWVKRLGGLAAMCPQGDRQLSGFA